MASKLIASGLCRLSSRTWLAHGLHVSSGSLSVAAPQLAQWPTYERGERSRTHEGRGAGCLGLVPVGASTVGILGASQIATGMVPSLVASAPRFHLRRSRPADCRIARPLGKTRAPLVSRGLARGCCIAHCEERVAACALPNRVAKAIWHLSIPSPFRAATFPPPTPTVLSFLQSQVFACSHSAPYTSPSKRGR